MSIPYQGDSNSANIPGLIGNNTAGGRGVVGNGFTATGVGVLGQNDLVSAVYGNSRLGIGVVGESQQPNGPGVLGENRAEGGRGVVGNGFTATGIGVLGQNGAGDAVFGNSGSGRGVVGLSTSQAGVVGESQTFDGVFGISHNPNAAGVSGHSLDHNGTVIPGGLAGYFDGNVTINGNLTMGSGGDIILSDFAEDFDIADAAVEPGTVMTIDQDGALRASNHAYDKSVAGVVSGAGDYRPAIILD